MSYPIISSRYMLEHNIRVEEDLMDQLFNSSEKRLARTILLLARYGKQEQPDGILPKVSQETLASMIGTTRSRVNFFMNKFRKLGFIQYNGKIKVNKSLLTVVLARIKPRGSLRIAEKRSMGSAGRPAVKAHSATNGTSVMFGSRYAVQPSAISRQIGVHGEIECRCRK